MNNYWIRAKSDTKKFYVNQALYIQKQLWIIHKKFGHIPYVTKICFNGLWHNFENYMKIDQADYMAGLWLLFLDLFHLKNEKESLMLFELHQTLEPIIQNLFKYIIKHVPFFEFENIMKRVMPDDMDNLTEYLIHRMYLKDKEKTKDDFENILEDMEEILQ